MSLRHLWYEERIGLGNIIKYKIITITSMFFRGGLE